MTDIELTELDRLRAELEATKAALKTEQGVQPGHVRCNKSGCDFGEKPAEYKRAEYFVYRRDMQGNLTNEVDTSHVMWELQGDSNCPNCKHPLSNVTPDARSAVENQDLAYPKRLAPWEMAAANG